VAREWPVEAVTIWDNVTEQEGVAKRCCCHSLPCYCHLFELHASTAHISTSRISISSYIASVKIYPNIIREPSFLALPIYLQTTMAAHSRQIFRFMALPRELRLMIYDFLPIMTKHHTICETQPGQVEQGNSTGFLTVVVLHTSVQVLRVCRIIRNEAMKTMALQLERIQKMTPRVMVDGSAIQLLIGTNGLFTLLANRFHVLRCNEKADFDSCSQPDRRYQISDGVQRFIQQAGRQMLSQWHKLEYFDPIPGAEFVAALFLGCRIRNDASFASRSGTVENMCDDAMLEIAYLGTKQELTGMICPCGHKLIGPSSSYPLGGSDFVLVWSLPVQRELQDQVSHMGLADEQMLAHLGMDRGWDDDEEITRVMQCDPLHDT
jgi:hypothetical protein